MKNEIKTGIPIPSTTWHVGSNKSAYRNIEAGQCIETSCAALLHAQFYSYKLNKKFAPKTFKAGMFEGKPHIWRTA